MPPPADPQLAEIINILKVICCQIKRLVFARERKEGMDIPSAPEP